MKLAKRYAPERLEAACGRALALNTYSYRSVESILKTNLDKQELPESSTVKKSVIHGNIRGKEYYKEQEAAHA